MNELEAEFIMYDVRAMVLNRMPDVLNPQRIEAEELTLRQLSAGLEGVEGIEPDVFEEAIREMMKKGYVDQLIGEDGEFYYQLTEEGREAGKEMFLKEIENELEEEDKWNELFEEEDDDEEGDDWY